MKTDWAQYDTQTKCFGCSQYKTSEQFDFYVIYHRTQGVTSRWRSKYCRGKCAQSRYGDLEGYDSRGGFVDTAFIRERSVEKRSDYWQHI